MFTFARNLPLFFLNLPSKHGLLKFPEQDQRYMCKQSFVLCKKNYQNACRHGEMTPNFSSSVKSHKSRADPIKVIIVPDTYRDLLKNISSVNKQCFMNIFCGV